MPQAVLLAALPALATAGGAIAGAKLSSDAAKDAAAKQAKAQQDALDFQKQQALQRQQRYDAAYANYKRDYDAWLRQYYPNYAHQLGPQGVNVPGAGVQAASVGPTAPPTTPSAPAPANLAAMATGSSRGNIGAPLPVQAASIAPPMGVPPGTAPMISSTGGPTAGFGNNMTLADLAGMGRA